MLPRWDIYCMSCGATERLQHNASPEVVRTLIHRRHEIAALQPMLREVDGLEVTSLQGPLPIAWLATHRDHNLAPLSEDGVLLAGACDGCSQTESPLYVVRLINKHAFCRGCLQKFEQGGLAAVKSFWQQKS